MKQRINIITIFFLFITLTPAMASDNSVPGDSTSIIRTEVNQFVSDGAAVFSQPFNWTKKDWMTVGIFGTGIAMTALFDRSLKQYSQAQQNNRADKLFMIDEYYGSGKTLIISGGFYISGLLFKDKKIRHMGLLSFEAFIYSGIIANLVKPVLGRGRPYANETNLTFHPFNLNDDFLSFPSGHTTVAFAFSTVMAKSVDNIYWDVFWYGLSTLTGAARIYHNRHWVSDVAGGAVLGYFVGQYLFKRNMNTDSRIHFLFQPNKITLSYHFR